MWGGSSRRRLAAALGLAFAAAMAGGCAAETPWHLPGDRSASGDPGDRIAAGLRRELEAANAATPAEAVALPGPQRPATPAQRDVWVEIERPVPEPAPTVVRSAWLEVGGVAGTRGRRAYDVVIAIDVSGSTQYASGADVNGNGVVGERRRRIEAWRQFEQHFYCSDPGDTVLDAERVATRRLIERLDSRRTRIGLVSFSDIPRPRGALGSSHELLSLVLDDLAGAFGAGPTNLAEATRLASRMLLETGEDRSTAPDPVVLILSDGYPTHPDSEERAAEEALAAAREAGEAGIRVSSLALGIDEPREPDVFAEMARLTGGEHLRVAEPGDAPLALPGIDLAQVAGIDIENLTTGADARAIRVRPDGSFDGYLRLRPGENRLRVTARGDEGGVAYLERRVVYDDRLPPDPTALERMRKDIELRTVEIELEREARVGRAAQRKVIRVEPESDVVD